MFVTPARIEHCRMPWEQRCKRLPSPVWYRVSRWIVMYRFCPGVAVEWESPELVPIDH